MNAKIWIVVAAALMGSCGRQQAGETAEAVDSTMFISDSTHVYAVDSTQTDESGLETGSVVHEHPEQQDTIVVMTEKQEPQVTGPEPTTTRERPIQPTVQQPDNRGDKKQNAGTADAWQAPVGTPRKLYYSLLKRGSYVNEPVDIKIELWDNENKPVSGKKPYTISVIIQDITSNTETRDSLTITPGNSEGVYRFTPAEPGIYKILFDNPEMLPAERKINVLNAARKLGYRQNNTTTSFRLVSLQNNAPYILVSTQEDRVSLADGEDFAEVGFLLVDPENQLGLTDSVRIIITHSNGNISRRELYVNKIDFENVQITSTEVASIRLEFRCTNPSIPFDKSTIKVNFSAAIDHIELSLSPPQISLFEKCQVIVRLKNKQNKTVATDKLLSGSFGILRGNGRFAHDTLQIHPGKDFAQIHFQPITSDTIVIQAHMLNLPAATNFIQVSWPWLLISLASAFGLIGSFGANRRQRTKWMTILFGAITGLALYWLVLFFMSAIAPQVIVLNPISAIVLGTCGGFAGTEVLRIILKRFGIEV